MPVGGAARAVIPTMSVRVTELPLAIVPLFVQLTRGLPRHRLIPGAIFVIVKVSAVALEDGSKLTSPE